MLSETLIEVMKVLIIAQLAGTGVGVGVGRKLSDKRFLLRRISSSANALQCNSIAMNGK